jgi:acyl carrier protein
MSIDHKLAEIFSVVLDLPPGSDVQKLRRIAEPKWDSLAHTSLVAAIESEFDIRLNVADGGRITSYRAAHLLLQEKCAKG